MKIRRLLTGVLCAGLLSLAGQHAAKADEVTLDSVKKAGVLRIGTWLQYEPEMYKDLKTGEIKGFWIELARKMAADLGVKLEIVDSDWDGLIPGLQSGKFEIVLAQMAITSKRAQAVDFAKPWEAVGLSLVLPADSTCDTVECLNKADKMIATEIGSVNQEVKKIFFPLAQETANKGHNDGFLQVVSHRADGFLTDNVSALAYLKEHPGSAKVAFTGVDKPFLQAFPAGPAVPKGSIAFARWVDIWLQDQINNGTYKKLYLQEIGWEPALEELGRQRGWYP